MKLTMLAVALTLNCFGTAQAQGIPVQEPEAATFKVAFPLGSAQLTPAAVRQLRALAPALTDAHQILITGYTDASGTEAVNRALADRRAMAVMTTLRGLLRGSSVELAATGSCCAAGDRNDAALQASRRSAELLVHTRDATELRATPLASPAPQ